MQLKINGKIEQHSRPLSLSGLLDQLGINPETVAVEVNLDIITRDKRSDFVLKDGDEVEIVKFVGGGYE